MIVPAPMIDSTMVMSDDRLSLSMFWVGALMVFTPLIGAGAVLAVWWRQRLQERGEGDEQSSAQRGPPPPPQA